MIYLHQPSLPLKKPAFVKAALFSTLLLSACGGSSSDNDDSAHTDTQIQSDGRLAVYDADAQEVKVLDLEDGSALASFALSGSAPRLYPLPGDRYTAVLQRDDNKVSFIDGGLYTEDHVDHLHDYAETPSMLDFTLSGVKPTHYEASATDALIFNDGDDANVASVTVFSATSIAAGETLIELNQESNMHGAAKLVDGHLFVTYRDASITDTTLPAEVERYAVADGVATFVERYDQQCPRLHGAGYNHDVLVFGCADGILAIDLQGTDYPASKHGSPASMAAGSRIGTVYAHHDVLTLVTRAGTQLFATAIEGGAVSYQELVTDEGVSPLAQDFTPNGEFFWVLGNNGKLYLWQANGSWNSPESFTVSSAEPSSVYVASSTTKNLMYLLEADKQRIVEVDYETRSVSRTFELDFNASGLSWMGLADHEHAEGHSHD